MTKPLLYPLTFPQQSIWDIETFYGNTSYANLVGGVIIQEKIDLKSLEKAVNIIIQRHDAIRLRFVFVKGEIYQYISEYKEYQVHQLDFTHPNGLKEFEDWKDAQTREPFQLLESDLFFIAFVKLSELKTALYIKFHHLISDLWSHTMIVGEVLNTYKDLVHSQPIPLEEKPSYLSYILEDVKYRDSPRYQKRRSFWQQLLQSIPEYTLINKKTTRNRDRQAKRRTMVISQDLCKEVKLFSEKYNVSSFVFLFAVFALYLSKLTNKQDLIIGTPVHNRVNHQQRNTAGMFISNIPVRIILDLEWDLLTYLNHISDLWKQLLKNQRFPYKEILKDLRAKQGYSGKLIDVVFSYHVSKIGVDNMDLETFWIFNGHEINTLSLSISDWKDDGMLRLDYDYLIEALTESEVEQIHHHFIKLLKDTISEPVKALSQFSLLTRQDKHELLHGLNNTHLNYPKEKTIHRLFEEQVKKTPEQIALIINDIKLTYEQLNERANQLAHLLRRKGIAPDSIISIMLNRSPELMISILAVLKAGGAYLPIDPQYPMARIEDMLRNSKTHILLTNPASIIEKEFVDQLEQTLGLEQINLGQSSLQTESPLNLVNINRPNDLAYVIYTSGSTGTPKGVMIEHRSVNNLIQALWKNFYFTEQKVIASLTTVAFDIFVMETLVPLSCGLCVVMANEEEQKIPNALFKLIKKYDIEILQATPSKIQSLLTDPNSSAGLGNLMDFFIGGEPFPEMLLKKLQNAVPSARIYNMYGPTETTVWSMYKELTKENHVTIGRPLANTQIYILDKRREPVPKGITGEIYIGGEGLARGYLYRTDLTEERFAANPFHEGETIYKTGDLGRWTTEGEIEYLGRNDDQVKVRGFRIELGEIEKCLAEHELIREAVVVTREDKKDKTYLCAYLVGNRACSTLDVRAYLEQRLPEYMIPAKYVWLDAIPLTPNSKVDKKSLPDPIARGELEDTAALPPRNSIDEELVELWSKALSLEHISIDDNFFLLGGDSLAIIEVLTGTWLREWDLNAQDFYDYPTVRQLSDKVRGIIKRKQNREQLDVDFPRPILGEYPPAQDRMPVLKGNVLLTGATGFLGMHLLWELLNSTTCTVYCLMRGAETEKRFRRLFSSYFSVSGGFDFSRIRIIKGDITKKLLGLTLEEYKELGDNVFSVIHAAGLVKHYGEYSEFEEVNVRGTREVIEFCMKFQRHLNHMSTISISGNQLADTVKNRCFSEAELYIGQNYHGNLYVRSKFEAEVQVLRAITSGLQATIFRVGILTGRYSDGKFQGNIHENAFYQMLKSILTVKAIPRDKLHQDLEFTPVDTCARGIINIIKTCPRTGRVFHLFNHKKIQISELIEILHSQGVAIKALDTGEFYQLVEHHLKTLHFLNGFVLNLTEEDQLDTVAKLEIQSNITQDYLARTGFEWPYIGEGYLKKILEYMIRVGFLQQII